MSNTPTPDMEQMVADFYEVEHGGHFLESDGFTTLPIVFDVLNKMHAEVCFFE
nr:hypothetical protein [Paenibacillus oralis]